jgi:hypothetical protein
VKIDLLLFMRFVGLVVAVLAGSVNVASSQIMADYSAEDTTLYDYCSQYQTLYTKIREQTITPDSARQEFSAIMLGLQNRFRSSETIPSDSAQRDSLRRLGTYFSFPIRGYTTSAIGGSHGEGYRGNGFDLFDYAVRGSHPAQDIFVVDRNQDNIDDKTGQPVDILAMSSGLVLAIETDWHPGSEYRGGNWIWIYDPILNGLFYYAHNNQVNVRPGQWVQAGQKIAEMGRSGYNAYKARSPTHLHLMYLQIQPDGLPQPLNTYPWLVTAKLSK